MKKKKILMIDDDDINNYIAEQWIKTSYEDTVSLMVYPDVEGAIQFLESCPKQDFPDLITCDLKMPGFDGFEFVEIYEEEFFRRYPDTRIVILSSSIRKDDMEKAKSYASVIDFVPKLSVQDNFKHIFSQYL